MKRWLFWLSGVVLLLLPPVLAAQEYLIDDAIGDWTTDAYTQIVSLTGGNWDDGYIDLAVPATHQFYFYGKKVTHLRIFTNGFVTFGFGAPPSDDHPFIMDPIPSTDLPNTFAAPWYDDWDLSWGVGEIWYSFHAAPYAHTCIEWRDIPHYNDQTARYKFSAVFFSDYANASAPAFSKNGILFEYYVVSSGTGVHDRGLFGAVGLESSTGTQGASYSYQTASLANDKDLYFLPFVAAYDTTNFDGAGFVDLMVYRPSQGVWKIKDTAGATQSIYFGGKYDVPLPGDFDNDSAADPCIFRPSQGRWRVQGPGMDVYWGTHGDIPVPADYNGDGKTDIAIFRPSTGMWKIRYTDVGTTDTVYFGKQGDIPVPYDYDGDLKADIAIVRPGAALAWRIQYSSGGSASFNYGIEGDLPVPADWYPPDYCVGIWRPSNGTWRLKDVPESWAIHTWGIDGDVALPGDFNIPTSMGYTDWAIWRPTAGMWRIDIGDGNPYTYYWGKIGDIPRFRRSAAIRASAGAARK
jgi:hypothetical protein